jgi:hypothetical protein
MATYTPIITDVGQQLILESIASGAEIKLKYFAWGDGNGYPVTPHSNMTNLVHEVYRQEITAKALSPDIAIWLEVLAVIPGTVGGFYIREVGLFTEDNKLFLVASHPEAYKTVPDQDGTSIDFAEKFIIEITGLTEVTIQVDPSASIVTYNDLKDHKHDGGVNSPSKVNLTNGAEVTGSLPIGMTVVNQDVSYNNYNLKNLKYPVDQLDGVNRQYLQNIGAFRAPMGLLVNSNPVSPNTIMDINIGKVLDSTYTEEMVLGSILHKDISSAWVVGSGGGLPSALTVQPDTTYYVFLIMKADGTTDVGYDIADNAANLLTDAVDYLYYRRIKKITTDGSGNIRQEYSIEKNDGSIECWYVNPVESINESSPATSLTDLILKGVPGGLACRASVLVKHISTGTNSAVELYSKLLGNTLQICSIEADTVSRVRDNIVDIYTNTLREIQYRVTGGTTRTVVISVQGYIDQRTN